jgi:hypothetical protein
MKRKLFLIIAGAAVLAFGCKKDDETYPSGGGNSQTQQTKVEPSNGGGAGASSGSPEQSKAKIEADASTFAAEMGTLSSLPSIKAVQRLASLLQGKVKSSVELDLGLPVTDFMVAASQNKTSSMLKSVKESDENESPSVDIMQVMEKVEGTYTWNFKTEQFDSSAAPEDKALLVVFPGDEASTSNNAEFKIYGISVSQVSSANTLYQSQSQLTGCKAYLSVDGDEVMTYSFAASYSEKGYPSMINTTITFDDYALSYDFMFNSGKFSNDYTFKKGQVTLLAQGMSFEGNLTEDKAKELVTYYNDSTIAEKKFIKISEFVSTYMIYFQFMDMKVVGSIDATGLTKFIDNNMDEFNTNEDEANQELVVKGLNDYCDLYAIFASSGSKIADTELYLKSTEDDKGASKVSPALKLVFPDGSSSDFGSYFGDNANLSDFNGQVDSFNKITQ